MADGIFIIKNTNQKIIKFRKLEQWIESLSEKLLLINNYAKGIFIDRASEQRKRILKII